MAEEYEIIGNIPPRPESPKIEEIDLINRLTLVEQAAVIAAEAAAAALNSGADR